MPVFVNLLVRRRSSNIYSKHAKTHSIVHVTLSLFMSCSLCLQSALNQSNLTGSMLVRLLLFEKWVRRGKISADLTKVSNDFLANQHHEKTRWTSSSILCLLFYHDVHLVRSKLFHRSFSCSVLLSNSAVFRNFTEFSFSIAIYSQELTPSYSPNSLWTSTSSAPTSTPFHAVYLGLGMKAPISCNTASEMCMYNFLWPKIFVPGAGNASPISNFTQRRIFLIHVFIAYYKCDSLTV